MTEYFSWERIFVFPHYFCTVWKSEKFSLTKKLFRQMNSLVKTLISRNFCQKCVNSVKKQPNLNLRRKFRCLSKTLTWPNIHQSRNLYRGIVFSLIWYPSKIVSRYFNPTFRIWCTGSWAKKFFGTLSWGSSRLSTRHLS